MSKELFVRVVNATNVAQATVPSCYMVVKYDGKQKKTTTIESHNPRWNQTLIFEFAEQSQPIAFRFMNSSSELCSFKIELEGVQLNDQERYYQYKFAESSEIYLGLKVIDPNTELNVQIDEENFIDAKEVVDWSVDLMKLSVATETTTGSKDEVKIEVPNKTILDNMDLYTKIRIKIIGIVGMLDVHNRGGYIMIKYRNRRKKTKKGQYDSYTPTWNEEFTFSFLEDRFIIIRFYNIYGRLVTSVRQDFELTLEPKQYEVQLFDQSHKAWLRFTIHMYEDPDKLVESLGLSCNSEEEEPQKKKKKVKSIKSNHRDDGKCKYCLCQCSKDGCRSCPNCRGCEDCGCACACDCDSSDDDDDSYSGCSDCGDCGGDGGCGDCDGCGSCGNCKGCQCSCKCSAPKCSGGCGSCDSDDDCCVIA